MHNLLHKYLYISMTPQADTIDVKCEAQSKSIDLLLSMVNFKPTRMQRNRSIVHISDVAFMLENIPDIRKPVIHLF